LEQYITQVLGYMNKIVSAHCIKISEVIYCSLTYGGTMSFIHFIDLLFFVILPVGLIAYAIKYAWEDIND